MFSGTRSASGFAEAVAVSDVVMRFRAGGEWAVVGSRSLSIPNLCSGRSLLPYDLAE